MILEIFLFIGMLYILYITFVKTENFMNLNNNKNFKIINLINEKPQISDEQNNIYYGYNIQPLDLHKNQLFKKFNVTSIIREIYFDSIDAYLIQCTNEDGIQYFILYNKNFQEITFIEPEPITYSTKEENNNNDVSNFYPSELQNKINMFTNNFTNNKNIIQSIIYSVDSKRI